jgi:hypothetical protein
MQSKIFLHLLDIPGKSSIALAIDHGNMGEPEIKLNNRKGERRHCSDWSYRSSLSDQHLESKEIKQKQHPELNKRPLKLGEAKCRAAFERVNNLTN